MVGVVDQGVVSGAEQGAVGDGGSPPWDQGVLWWTWHHAAGTVQPVAVQCRSRWAIAILWALVWNRTRRPRSRIWELLPSTAGMTPDWQASTRACDAEIR